jgi:hypothetical protein
VKGEGGSYRESSLFLLVALDVIYDSQPHRCALFKDIGINGYNYKYICSPDYILTKIHMAELYGIGVT